MKQKKNLKIDIFYTHLFSSGFFIVDEDESYFQEKVLQVIWNEQILKKNLLTESEDKLEIIHQGIWNVESGPDFHDAFIAINGRLVQGDVEIHFNPQDWNKHGHDFNSEYEKVILHCVWNNFSQYTEYPEGIPICNLSTFLKVPIKKLLSQIDFNTYTYARKVPSSKYATMISRLDDGHLSKLLQSHGISRILQKAHNFTQNIEKYGVDGAAHRALFDGMGYKNNRKPFQELASLISLKELSSYSEDVAIATLFGASGLLPDPTQTNIHPDYQAWVQTMWSIWWSKRKKYNPIQWNRHKFRPYNSPERRLVAAYYVLQRNSYQLGSKIIDIMASCQDENECVKKLHQAFAVNPHLNLLKFLNFSKTLNKPIALLGKDRINDLIINFAIPFFFAYCLIKNDPKQCSKGKKILLEIPRLQENRLLKEAIQFFLLPASRSKQVVLNACAQQGILELYKNILRNPAKQSK